MRNNPTVSTIVPTYNRASLLQDTLSSIKAQTFSDWELLIIDDGSSDGTETLVREHIKADARIRYIKANHQGVAAARNLGIKQAIGALVAFCDSDDLWLPEKLAYQVGYLQAHPEISLVYSDVMSVCGSVVEDPSYFVLRPPAEGKVFRALLERNFIANSSVVIRKACLESLGGFDASAVPSEDYDLWLRCAQDFLVGYVPQVLATIRRHGGNLTNGINVSYEAHLKVLQRIYAKSSDHTLRVLIKKACAATYQRIGHDYLVQSEFSQARAAWYRSLQHDALRLKVYGYLAVSLLPQPMVHQLRRVYSRLVRNRTLVETNS